MSTIPRKVFIQVDPIEDQVIEKLNKKKSIALMAFLGYNFDQSLLMIHPIVFR